MSAADLGEQKVEIGMPVEMVTRRLFWDGDERRMLMYGYPLTASGAPRVSGHPKGCKFSLVMNL